MRVLKILFIIVLFIIGIVYGGRKFYMKYIGTAPDEAGTMNQEPDANSSKGTVESEEVNKNESMNLNQLVNTESTKKPESTKAPESTKKPEDTKAPESTKRPEGEKKPDHTTNPSEPQENDGSKNTTKIDESYFDDAVFIGDSRTEGFGMYTGLKKATFYAEKGLKVDTIFENKSVKIDGSKMTIVDALKKQSFGKVYIMLGVNELGWIYGDVFIDKYVKLIEEIKKAQPDAEIYIQSIIHINRDKVKNPPSYYSNKLINERNKLIKAMAKEQKVHYIDINKVLTNDSGELYKDASTDGIHLNLKYCNIWKDYLLENTAVN